jgi:polyisoprenoid-binding protein YceI
MKKILIFSFFLTFLALVAGAEMQSFAISSVDSLLTFDTSAQIHKVHGQTKQFSGTITGDPSDITSAKIHVKLDPKTFDTENEKRDKVMREKSLEVDQFPWIEFESTSVQAAEHTLDAGKPLDATIKGILKMHGFEKELEVPVKILLEKEKITAEGDLVILLDQYKIFRPKVLFFQLQNEVHVHFKIGATRGGSSS